MLQQLTKDHASTAYIYQKNIHDFENQLTNIQVSRKELFDQLQTLNDFKKRFENLNVPEL
jgi:prefoldin subunit 5